MTADTLREFKELVRSRTDIVELIGETVELHQQGGTFKGLCPFHDDRNPSFTVNDERQSYRCWSCSAGGDCLDFAKALYGISFKDALVLLANRAGLELPPHLSGVRVTVKATEKRAAVERKPVKPPKSYLTAEEAIEAMTWVMVNKLGMTVGPQWPYHSVSGKIVAYELRFNGASGKKEFRLVSLHGAEWFNRGPPIPRPLYRLPSLATANVIVVTEGAKCADIVVNKYGLIATTAMCGSKSPQLTDWTPLAGKRVIKLPDNDKPGIAFIGTVSQMLSKNEPLTIESEAWLSGLPPGGDIADWDGTREELLRLCGL